LNVNYYRQLKKKKNLDKLFSPNDRKFLAAWLQPYLLKDWLN
jgi:hypothetical protein